MGLYLVSVGGDGPYEPALVTPVTAHRDYRAGDDNQVGLIAGADAIHLAWLEPDGDALRVAYERRPRDGGDPVRTVFGPSVAGDRLFLARRGGVPHAIVLTPRGQIASLDLGTPPERAQLVALPLGDSGPAQILLDVITTPDDAFHIAWTDRSHRTWLGRAGRAPAFISDAIVEQQDTLELAIGPDGHPLAVYTESYPGAGTHRFDLRLQRPIAGAPPAAVVLDTFQYVATARPQPSGIAVARHSSGALDVFAFDPAFEGVTRHIIRPARDVTTVHQRVDGTSPLGRPDDIDADGIADDVDNCHDVWNPQQTDRDDNGIGDICEICAAPPIEPSPAPASGEARRCDATEAPVVREACDWVPDARRIARLSTDLTIVVDGSTGEGSHHHRPSCADVDSRDANDDMIALVPEVSGPWILSTRGSSFDTVLTVLDDCRADQAAELACNLDTSPAQRHSELRVELTGGTRYFVIVDGHDGAEGAYTLTISPAQ